MSPSSIATRVKTAAVGLPVVVAAISTVTGTACLLAAVLVAAVVEYEALARGICKSKDNDASRPRRAPWRLLTASLGLLGLALVLGQEAGERLVQGPVIYYLAVLLALLNLGATLARRAPASSSSSAPGVRTRRMSLAAEATLRNDLVRLLLDSLALAVVAGGCLYLLLLRMRGLWQAVFFVACCWNTDNGALLFGSLGGPTDPIAKVLLPAQYRGVLTAISPKKTATGVVGGLVLGTLTSLAFGALDHHRHGASQSPFLLPVLTPALSLRQYALLGLAIAFLAQAGDLLESFVKRAAGTKDSGSLLPGHGGVLDRIDSLLLGAPLFHQVVVLLSASPSR